MPELYSGGYNTAATTCHNEAQAHVSQETHIRRRGPPKKTGHPSRILLNAARSRTELRNASFVGRPFTHTEACKHRLIVTGDKAREQKEASERSAEDQRQAGGSYSTANPDDLDAGSGEEGLPWGSISLRHIVSTGRSKEKDSRGDSTHTTTSRDRSSLR
jgi:hypothetical protein